MEMGSKPARGALNNGHKGTIKVNNRAIISGTPDSKHNAELKQGFLWKIKESIRHWGIRR
jgi:hypothetical protein